MSSQLDPCVVIVNTGVIDTTAAKTRNIFIAPVACVLTSIKLFTGTTVTASADDFGSYAVKNLTKNVTYKTITTAAADLTADTAYEYLTAKVEVAAGDVIQFLASETLASAPTNAGAGSLDVETILAVTYVPGEM